MQYIQLLTLVFQNMCLINQILARSYHWQFHSRALWFWFPHAFHIFNTIVHHVRMSSCLMALLKRSWNLIYLLKLCQCLIYLKQSLLIQLIQFLTLVFQNMGLIVQIVTRSYHWQFHSQALWFWFPRAYFFFL